MKRLMVWSGRVALALVLLVLAANYLHRVVWPQPAPDPATFPRAGDRFGSSAEGFMQEVVAVRAGWLVLRTRAAPHAPGPPLHIHSAFAEQFRVESGTLSVRLPGRVLQLQAGESHRIEPGVAHQPFNATASEVVIANDPDAPAMPQAFGACLVQTYHFLDEARGQLGPGLLLRIAGLGDICDSRLPEVPAVAQQTMQWLVLPFARLWGYRNYYPEYSLHP